MALSKPWGMELSKTAPAMKSNKTGEQIPIGGNVNSKASKGNVMLSKSGPRKFGPTGKGGGKKKVKHIFSKHPVSGEPM